MKQRVIGISILILVVIIGVVIGTMNSKGSKQEIVVSGYIGGEKEGFFQDEKVQSILKKKYNLVVDYTRAGSYEMMDMDTSSKDFLFPSSQVALEIYKGKNAAKIKQAERVFQSPIVLYSWTDIAKALEAQGIAKSAAGGYYTVDMLKLLEYVKDGKSWSDLGVDLYGKIKVLCTDPNKSNSGNMYAGLVYQILANNDYPKAEAMNTLNTMIKNIGFMETSSGTLFESYLIKGKGANPLVIGYENQIIEFALANPDIWNRAKGNVTILVPEPTVWSEHPVIALTDHGKLLIQALADKEIQEIAWKNHGFRYPSFQSNDNEVIPLPESLDKITEMPSVQEMQEIMNMLSQ
jgi:ABC-type Fe3+ transport system substrate-binding protein